MKIFIRKKRDKQLAELWFKLGFRYGFLEPKSYFPDQFSGNIKEIDEACDKAFENHWDWFGRKLKK